MQLAVVENPLAPKLNPESGTAAIGILSKIIALSVSALLVAGTVAFVFWFILGAIRWIMSSGDKAQIEAARNQIINAVIGLVILFSLFAILELINAFFGVNVLSLDLTPLLNIFGGPSSP